MRGVSRISRRVSGETAGRLLTCVLSLAMVLMFLATSCFGADPANKLVSVKMDEAAKVPTVLIQTEEPVGYRYTVYDSFDPVRVVIDFPGMDMANVAEVLPIGHGDLREVRVANFELSSGNLARVEILLDKSSEYQVNLDGSNFRISFSDLPASDLLASPAAVEQVSQEKAAVETVAQLAPEQTPADAEGIASVLREITLSPGKAILAANGEIQDYKYFTLASPPRLVVDIYGVRPGFKQRVFDTEAGMSQLRIGTYKEKTRFVFDAESSALPEHTVDKQDTDIAVVWGNTVAASAPEVVAADAKPEPAIEIEAPAKPRAAKKISSAVAIEAIDFESENGRSYISVSLSGPGEIAGPTLEGNLVRFEVKNATISRALRRTLDTSAFPTAVTSVTPYTVTEGNFQNVRIAVDLKGSVAYALEQEGSLVRLIVDDGAYAEVAPPEVSVVEVPAPKKAAQATTVSSPGSLQDVDDAPLPDEANYYTGQKISLVFDSADIRSILQLIGDVSEMNILASDDVKGSITLRLIDVPWDQALALILETSDLGKIQQGNVMRIMPKDKIREMAQSDLLAQKHEIEEAPLESRVFQISYSSVDDIKKVISDLLTERGNIIADARNKQMIVKDVPTVLDEMLVLIKQIDQPEKQVMIEARIVEANTNFSRDLGVKWGFNYDNDVDGVGATGLDSSSLGLGGAFMIPTPGLGGVGGPGAAAGLSFGTLGIDSVTMDIRLAALESAGEGKIVSTPRVTTLNGEKATISQGTKIPYTTVSDTGTETSFESAELKLEVTPEINPDGSVILDIKASNSAVGSIVPTGTGNAISIDEKKAETKVLVMDGETTVIGGIFVEDERDADSGVPLLKDIPLLGHLFKSTLKTKDRRELLIFITPRILE